MLYCNFCGAYTGLFNCSHYCSFCSNLRRVVMIYGKDIVDGVVKKQLLGVSIVKEDNKEEGKELHEDGRKTPKESKEQAKKIAYPILGM